MVGSVARLAAAQLRRHLQARRSRPPGRGPAHLLEFTHRHHRHGADAAVGAAGVEACGGEALLDLLRLGERRRARSSGTAARAARRRAPGRPDARSRACSSSTDCRSSPHRSSGPAGKQGRLRPAPRACAVRFGLGTAGRPRARCPSFCRAIMVREVSSVPLPKALAPRSPSARRAGICRD